MAFQIINNTKVDENRIEWKFETLDKVFVSTSDKFKRNIAFWQAKYNIGTDVKVEILNGVEHLYAHLEEEKNIVDVEATIVEEPQLESRLEENEYTINNDPAIESRVDEPTEQSDLFEDLESDVNPPKRKPRKKTS
jgi:hypothetical protein